MAHLSSILCRQQSILRVKVQKIDNFPVGSPFVNPYRYIPEKLLILLVLVTIGVLLFPRALLETRLMIDSADDVHLATLDSDVQDGGNTETEWLDRENLHWRCDLGQDYAYPFCGMQLYFTDSYLNGVDLSRYSHINLHLDYRGSAESVRLFLRNSHPAYTRSDEIRSTKFNMVELDISRNDDGQYRDIKLSYFRVADWWLRLYPMDMKHSTADFSNVGLIEIQSGTGLSDGEHEFQLHRLELVGLRLPMEQLYLMIIVGWICAIVLYLAARIRVLTLAVRTGQDEQAELREVNELLDRRSQTLEKRIKLDPLTGAYNRAGIEDSLRIAFSNWRFNHQPLSLLLLDLDYFKDVNDNHGHTVGDDILRELSALVSENIRHKDHFARWGGEEFIVVSNNTDLWQARELAEKLRQLIGERRFSHGLQITVSIGVGQIRTGESLEALFKRTDEALYEAKHKGRNRVEIAH